MSGKRQFFIEGQELASEPHHYTACGLDDVYLLNGFTMEKTDYGPGISIDNVDGLHRAIALHLVLHRKALSPKEFRFLRKQMNLTQKELATSLGVSDQSVARYEKAETEIAGPSDRLVRFYYALSIIPEDLRAGVLEALNTFIHDVDQDEVNVPPAYFSVSESGWTETSASMRS